MGLSGGGGLLYQSDFNNFFCVVKTQFFNNNLEFKCRTTTQQIITIKHSKSSVILSFNDKIVKK